MTEVRIPDIEEGWQEVLADEFANPYMAELKEFLVRDAESHRIYPPPGDVFNALSLTPFEMTRVVILGQDPYHGPGQAHGLCFSVPEGIDPPPSLKNMFKEIHSSLGVDVPASGDLTPWACQGVLLLNTTLTVRHKSPASHAGQGWETFTDAVIRALNDRRAGVVFMLWGSHARRKAAMIDRTRHFVLEAPHPSPLSAHRGFFGCNHFAICNDLLTSQGLDPIDWSLNPR